GNEFYDNGGRGITLGGAPGGVTFQGIVRRNSKTTANTQDGIYVEGDNCTIFNSIIDGEDFQRNGVRIKPGVHATLIAQCRFMGNTGDSIWDEGTGTIKLNNIETQATSNI